MIAGLTVVMMVRDEATRVGRALASARAVAERWLVIDTGSTDDTIDQVRRATRGWRGQLHHRPWVDFGTNRSQLLQLGAASGARWLLMLDADHELVDVDQDRLAEVLATTSADALQLPYTTSPQRWVSRLIRCGPAWSYIGTTHEYLDSPTEVTVQRVDAPRVLDHADGAARAVKWRRDLVLLQQQVTERPADGRAWFYLGETHRALLAFDQAVHAYRRCAAVSGTSEQAYAALLYAGCLRAALQQPDEAIDLLTHADQLRPARREALLQLCRILNDRGEHARVLDLLHAELPITRPVPAGDTEGIYPPAYDQDMLTEHTRAAAGCPELGHTDGACLRPKRARTTKPGPHRTPRRAPRWPRIVPVMHGEDPRFDTRAACGLQAAHLFDERDKGEPADQYLRRVDQARSVCGSCPVSAGCLEFGMRNELNGMFGGVLLERGLRPRPRAQQSA